MEIIEVTYEMVKTEFEDLKPDLIDKNAIYFGCIINDSLVGIVSFVEHEFSIYLCHAYVKEEFRNLGIYNALWNYRDNVINLKNKEIYAHCNVNSLKQFLNKGYTIEKTLFKVIK